MGPLARGGPQEQTGRVPVASYHHYLEAPIIAVAALAVIVLICRWVFSTDRPTPSATERYDYGLLVAVTAVRTLDDAQMLRGVLGDAGIRSTVTQAPDGFSVLVFRADAERARGLVRS